MPGTRPNNRNPSNPSSVDERHELVKVALAVDCDFNCRDVNCLISRSENDDNALFRLHRQQPQFQAEPLRRCVTAWFVPRGDDAMAGDDDRKTIRRHHAAHSPRRARISRLLGQLSVTDRLAVGNSPHNFEDASLKIGSAGQRQQDIVEVDAVAQTIAFEPAPQCGVPICLAKIPIAGLRGGRAANICRGAVSSKYGSESRLMPE